MNPPLGWLRLRDVVRELEEGRVMEAAIWYWRYGAVGYVLCDTEEDAARQAASMMDGDDCAVDGVQLADGRYMRREEWPALREEDDRRYRRMEQQVREDMAKPKPATRTVRAPIGDQTVVVPADAPLWLGRP